MFISMNSIHGWASFCMNYCINVAWHEGDQSVTLLRCNEAQVALIAAFRSTALLGLVSLIFLFTILHRFSMFRSGEFAGQSSTVTPWSLNQLLVPLAVWASPAGKWNLHLHKACQQKEAWSAIKCPDRWLRWLWTSENTVDQHQQTSWQPKSSQTGNFTLDFKQRGFCVSPLFLQTLGPWFTNEIYFHLKAQIQQSLEKCK